MCHFVLYLLCGIYLHDDQRSHTLWQLDECCCTYSTCFVAEMSSTCRTSIICKRMQHHDQANRVYVSAGGNSRYFCLGGNSQPERRQITTRRTKTGPQSVTSGRETAACSAPGSRSHIRETPQVGQMDWICKTQCVLIAYCANKGTGCSTLPNQEQTVAALSCDALHVCCCCVLRSR